MAPFGSHHDDDVKAKPQRRASQRSHRTEVGVREREEGNARAPLGSRIVARFAGIGCLKEEIAELRGQEPRPADFES